MKRAVPVAIALATLVATTGARADDEPPAGLWALLRPEVALNARSFYGSPLYTVEGSFGMGVASRRFGVWLGVGGMVGRTGSGLDASGAFVMLGGEGAIDRTRVGGEARVGYLAIDRVTSDDTLHGTTFGLGAHVTYDVKRWNEARSALFVGAAVRVDVAGGKEEDGPTIVGPSALFGARL